MSFSSGLFAARVIENECSPINAPPAITLKPLNSRISFNSIKASS